MKTLYTVILLLFACSGYAQQFDEVKLRIHYKSDRKRFETTPNRRSDEKILDIGTKSSKFYSLWETSIENVKDSAIAHGGSFEDVQNAIGRLPYPHSYEYYEVYKNYPAKGRLTYTDKVFKFFIYEEALDEFQWNILPEDTLIAGYNCQKAQTDFRGRTWQVWFAPDIPVSDGPWKLHGLPGLILSAKDSEENFIFECIEIKNGKNEAIAFKKRNYIKCADWKELNEMHIKCAKNPDEYLAQFGLKAGPGFGPDGKPLVHKEKKAILLEH